MEQVEQLIPHLCEHVRLADPRPLARQRDVDGIGGLRECLMRPAAAFFRFPEPTLDQVQPAATALAVVDGQVRQLGERVGDDSAFAPEHRQMAFAQGRDGFGCCKGAGRKRIKFAERRLNRGQLGDMRTQLEVDGRAFP